MVLPLPGVRGGRDDWDGDYYALPDAEFVAQSRPGSRACRRLIATGDAEDYEFRRGRSAAVPRGPQPVPVRRSTPTTTSTSASRLPTVPLRLQCAPARCCCSPSSCGLAILVAGVRAAAAASPARTIRRRRSAIGEVTAVGDMQVVVEGVSRARGASARRRRDRWRRRRRRRRRRSGSSSRAVRSRPTRRPATTAGRRPCGSQPCTLAFELGADAGSTRVLLYRRGDEQVRWDLTG